MSSANRLQPTRRKLTYFETLITDAKKSQGKRAKNKTPRELLSLVGTRISDSFEAATTWEDRMACYLVGGAIESYLTGTTSLYKLANGFGRHLADTKLNLPIELLPQDVGKFYVLEFPESVLFSTDSCYWRHAIVSIGHNSQGNTLQICAPDYTFSGEDSSVDTITVISLGSYETIEEAIDSHKRSFACADMPDAMISYIAKCLVYIESGEPDLRNVDTQVRTRNYKKQSIIQKNNCLFAHTLVGYGFHNRHYHVNATSVRGHFRWQPCGPERKQVKLIWIDEHVRNYIKEGI